MIALNGFQMRETSDREPPLVAFPLSTIAQSLPGKNFPRLQAHGTVRVLQLLINAKRAQWR
jgi:hypothetical protein